MRTPIFKFLLVSFFVLLRTSGVLAQTRTPRFSDYPVKTVYRGKNAPIRLTRDDMDFRTRLRWAAKRSRPNFAGRYILTTWGCGTSCVGGAVVDAKTGKVSWWDFSVCCWPNEVPDDFEPIEVKLNSNLIVFNGARNEKEGDIGKHYYKFVNGRFIHLKTVLNKTQQ
jgi:hypothetical protein